MSSVIYVKSFLVKENMDQKDWENGYATIKCKLNT
jgi:hypothetical protein